ncbi:DUF3592 domain-containing protein [Flavobacterium sp. ALJ2]|uniref:DUF3592 domain-containing protein n=1 Tax=Flavobacterium sp. ALJ2 TaxID=2786960 RepID=UPI00189E11E7|nr:DUF3592 domain-containing protein [Flavobacterium sp. ALJ2]MBF7090052.1 DUF3592 domain-containing protein [Flavobacterium sp. ALJ2]
MRTLTIIKYLFLGIGLVMLGGAIYLYQDKQHFLKNAEVAQGTVVELISEKSNNSITYWPVVSFTTKAGNEVEFKSSVGSNPPSHNRGERVEVLYDDKFPHEAVINGFASLWVGSLILGGLGFVFFLIGFSMILYSYLKQQKIQHLLKNGKLILTKFNQVELNYSLNVNGRNPFQIHSQWLDPSKQELYIFISENIWFDPTEFIEKEGIKVFIEPSNPKKYYMDISFLPKHKK